MQPSAPTPPHINGSPKRNGGALFAAIGGGFFLLLIGGFLALWQFLQPTDVRVQTTYSEFLAEVKAGHVDEIRVHDRDIDYRIRALDGNASDTNQSGPHARNVMRHTTGPVPDQAFLDTLKPADPNAVPPKIMFDK